MDKILLPKELTAENGAKKLLIGEFKEKVWIDCQNCAGEGCIDCDFNAGYHLNVSVGWDTIKEIYKKIVDYYSNRS